MATHAVAQGLGLSKRPEWPPHWMAVLSTVIALLALFAQSSSARSGAITPTTKSNLDYLKTLSIAELLNQTVTTPSRIEESRDLAPGAVYVFDAETIRKRGYRSLGDLLRVVPGFSVFHKGLHLSVGVRGLNPNDNEKVTLLINGRESNNVQEPDFLNGPINLQTFERVEVVIGPSSFFQRANTLAATVNIITKKLDGVELSYSGGTDTDYSANGIAGKRWGSEKFVTGSLTFERKDGFAAGDSRYKTNLWSFKERGQLDRSVFAVLEGQWGNSWGQFIAYESNHPELGLRTAAVYEDPRYQDQMFLVNLKQVLDINEDLSVDALFDAGYKKVARLNKSRVVGPKRELEYAQVDYSGELALKYRGVENHDIYAGLQAAYEDNLRNFAIQNGLKYTLISPSNDSHAAGIYFYDRCQVTDRIKLEGGIRGDYNSLLNGDRAFNWGGRIAFAHELVGRNVTWISKLIANRAVRYPSAIAALNEAWGSDKPAGPTNPFTISTPADKAEKLITGEWQNILYWYDTRVSGNFYYQYLRDFISFFNPHTNVGNFSGFGFELEVRQGIGDEISLWANASIVDSELKVFESGGGAINTSGKKGQILGSPSYTMNAGVDAEITEHFTLFGQLRYFTRQAAFKRPEEIYKKVDHQVYLDLTATYVALFVENVDLGFAIQNLLDNRQHVSFQWQRNQYRPRGRTPLATLRVHF